MTFLATATVTLTKFKRINCLQGKSKRHLLTRQYANRIAFSNVGKLLSP